jgi:hypothetical protein
VAEAFTQCELLSVFPRLMLVPDVWGHHPLSSEEVFIGPEPGFGALHRVSVCSVEVLLELFLATHRLPLLHQCLGW